MNILLIHQAFAALNEPGGTRHHELARYLAGQGHRVIIITGTVNYMTGNTLGKEGIERTRIGEGEIILWRTKVYRAFHRSFIHRTFSFISFMLTSFWAGFRQRNVDIVWGTSPPIFQAVSAWLIAWLHRKPFLLEIRDLWPAFAIQVGVLKNPVLIRLSEWLERFLIRRATRLLVNSPGFIPYLREKGAQRIDCVPNGSDPQLFETNQDGDRFRKENGLTEKYLVLYAGAHGMSNDLGTLLRCAEMVQTRAEIVFIFLGDGKEKPALMKQAEGMGLRNVLFLPPVAKTEMAQIINAVDACVAILKPIPLYGTVYPNKVFDYMAAGKPVVLAIEGVIKKVIEEENAGVAVPPGDAGALAQAIVKLAENPLLGKELGANGRRAIERRFNRQSLAQQFLMVLDSIIKEA